MTLLKTSLNLGYDVRSAALRRAEALMVIIGTVAGLPTGADEALPTQANRHVHADVWQGLLVEGLVAWHPPGGLSPAGRTNGDHVPLLHVQRTLDELTDRWIARNPHLRTHPDARAS